MSASTLDDTEKKDKIYFEPILSIIHFKTQLPLMRSGMHTFASGNHETQLEQREKNSFTHSHIIFTFLALFTIIADTFDGLIVKLKHIFQYRQKQ